MNIHGQAVMGEHQIILNSLKLFHVKLTIEIYVVAADHCFS